MEINIVDTRGSNRLDSNTPVGTMFVYEGELYVVRAGLIKCDRLPVFSLRTLTPVVFDVPEYNVAFVKQLQVTI